MSNLQVLDFNVPVYDGLDAKIYILWHCSAPELRRFMLDQFAVDPGERDAWSGKCLTDSKVDRKHHCPTAIIALRRWGADPDSIALLAHECFHAAEWILKQSGCVSPPPTGDGRWEAWEDMAYLLQRIVRRALEGIAEKM